MVYAGLLEEVGGFDVGRGDVEGLEVGMRVGGTGLVPAFPAVPEAVCEVCGVWYPGESGPLMVPPPPVLVFVEPCLHVVVTLQLSQSKVMVPKMF